MERNCLSRIEELQSSLTEITQYLDPLLPLANAHTVDFIVEHLWTSKIPSNIRQEAECLGIPKVIDQLWCLLQSETVPCSASNLYDFVKQAGEYVVEKLDGVYFVNDLMNILLDSSSANLRELVEVTEYMSVKKLHEVHIMSHVVACLAEASKSSVVVDIGSGKGYLPSVLALNHNLRILGIDDKPTNIDGAIRTTKMLEKKWKMYERKSSSKRIGEMKNSNQTSGKDQDDVILLRQCLKSSAKSTVLGVSYKHRVECVSSQTDVCRILSEEYPNEEHSILFVGLHTCGNLSPNSFKLFLNCNPKKKAIINVGCCYHLIDEEFCSDPEWHLRRTMHRNAKNVDDFGFPLSDFLRQRKFSLGRDARMCGTQNPLKIFKEQELIKATKPLFYRALLQQLLILKCGPSNLPDAIVGRIAHKCVSFAEYATKAMKKLNVDVEVTPAELSKFEAKNDEHWQRLKIFFLLKTALSPVIETVILLDKLLYLYEQGIKTAFITRLFDPVVSPRCYAVIAIQK